MQPSPQAAVLQATNQKAARKILAFLFCLSLFATTQHLCAQAALLLEQPYGVFGTLNPTGHAAIYLQRVCADSPVYLRECEPGETGVVISRYKGMGGYDWVAIPLIPYLYAVEDPARVPDQVNEESVNRLRARYREENLGAFGESLPPGNFVNGGWTQLIGTAYDRRTYAFRFSTTPEQDRELIRRLNDRPNRSHFNILYNNCADFDRFVLKNYFPNAFGRTVFPDAGISTPKHITYALVKYAQRHPDAQLSILAIPQVPGYRRQSRAIHGVAESLFVNGYVIPIVVLNPYVAGGLLVDYLVRGRYQLVPKNPVVVGPEHMEALIQPEPIPSVQPTLLVENPSAPGEVLKGESGADIHLKQPVDHE
jgi:hypothetical protein